MDDPKLLSQVVGNLGALYASWGKHDEAERCMCAHCSFILLPTARKIGTWACSTTTFPGGSVFRRILSRRSAIFSMRFRYSRVSPERWQRRWVILPRLREPRQASLYLRDKNIIIGINIIHLSGPYAQGFLR